MAASLALTVGVGCAVAAVVLGALHVEGFFRDWGALLAIFFAFAAVGWVVATRHGGNPVGWLLLLFGCLPLVVSLLQVYAELAFAGRQGLPAGAFVAWLGELPWHGIWSVFALVLLLFPTGRPVSPPWRWVVRAVAANALAAMLVSAVALWPLRADLVGPQRVEPGGWLGALMALLALGVGLGMVASAASLVVRYRTSGAVQRAQLKWLAYAGVPVIAAVVLVVVRNVAGQLPDILRAVELLGVASVPVAMGVAILRYRLYDIDRIISRTVSYALLTGLLAAVYGAVVILGSRLVAPLGAGSDLAVAAATLAAAAVFAPARWRIQTAVDGRFNRASYDAEQAVTDFRRSLRDEMDLDAVSRGVLGAARKTVQPAAFSIWLRGAR